MGSKKTAGRGRKHPAASPRSGSRSTRRRVIVAVVVASVAGALWWWKDGRDEIVRGRRDTGDETSTIPASPTSAQNLIGRWQRMDAGYVIEIRGIDGNGHVEAAYFNPNAIHVSQARVSNAGEGLDLFIELMDVGYPGATYTLHYIPEYDVLAGVYHQPTAGQDFEVAFKRK